MNETEIEVGDTVVLAGTVPLEHDLKTVVAVSAKGATCVWDGGAKPRRQTYPVKALKLVKKRD